MSNYMPQRHRRSDRHQKNGSVESMPPQESRRPSFQEDVPLPLGSESRAFPAPPEKRDAPLIYDEDRYPGESGLQSGYDADNEYDDYDDEPPRRWPLIALIAVLVLLMLLAALYLLGPKDNQGTLGMVRKPIATVVDKLLGIQKEQTPVLIKFETAEPYGVTGTRTVFNFTTDIAVDDVRLQDESGTVLSGTANVVDAPANTLWTVAVTFNEPFEGPIYASIHKNDKWYFEGKFITLGITRPTLAPTLAPTIAPTPVPTLAPTMAPTLAPAPQATTPPTDAPTLPPAGTVLPAAEATPGATYVVRSLQTAPPFIPPVSIVAAGDTAETADLPPEDGQDAADGMDEMADAGDDAELPDDMAEAADNTGDADEQPADTAETADALADADSTSDGSENTPAAPAAQAAQQPAMTLPALTAEADETATLKKTGYTETAYKNGKKQTKFTRDDEITFPAPDQYTSYAGGIFTFRGDNFRRNAAFGDADINLKQLSVAWEADMGSLNTSAGRVSGMGWTGQPAIVKWSKELRMAMNIKDDKKAVSPLKEVIFASQDGKVYFLDLNDGKPTRDTINVGFPLKSSVSVDPQGQPIIAFGQGVSKLSNKTGEIGFHLYNLLDQKKLYFINGRSSTKQSQYGSNGAFDGTALFDRTSDTMVVGGENGLLYTVKLNTKFDFQDPANMKLTASPEISLLKSKGKQANPSVSLEASAAAYNGYAFLADKQGYLRCVDMNTMKTVWVKDMGDNTDATPALDLNSDDTLSLYTGTTVFTRLKGKKTAVIRSLDAMSGKENWSYSVPAVFDKDERAGVKASPVVGEKNISHLVIFTVSNVQDGGSVVVALDKQSGQEVWKTPLTANTISSPVAVYDKNGNAYIIQGDDSGLLTMMDALTGETVNTLELGGKIEGSPAVYNDMLVIGTCNNKPKMYGIRIE